MQQLQMHAGCFVPGAGGIGGNMSISALANAAAARRPDIGTNTVPDGMAEIAAASATPPDQAKGQAPASGTNTALNVLFGYIPIEVVTLYVAVQAALQPPTPTAGMTITPQAAAAALQASQSAQWIAFWCFFVATPLVVWVIFASKIRDAGKPLPSTFDTWPVWEMFAATFAFCAWAFALPNTPFQAFASWYSAGLAGISVLLASTVLGLLAPLFQRPLGTGAVPAPAPPASGAEPTPPPGG